jgi:hypothetical protein
MLNMLPKLALIVVRMYFSVFAKVRRPSSMPSSRTPRSLCSRMKSAELLGHVHRGIHRDAHVGRVQRGRVVDAVAHVADHVAGLLQRQDDALLLVRVHLGEDRGALREMPQRLVAHLVEFGGEWRPRSSGRPPRQCAAPPCGCRR